MTKVSDIFGVSPKTVLNKPYLKARDAKDVNVDGGSSVVGTNTRVLNELSANSIAGASLASNQILLPAGSYYAEGFSCLYKTGESLAILRDANDGHRILARGPNILLASAAEVSDGIAFSGAFTLTAPGALELACFCDNAQATNGLGRGRAGSGGVFSEVHIWQLDADVRTPVATSSQSYNGQDYLTGGITGLNVVRTAANTISVTAGACMDSTNAIALGLLADEVGIAVPTVINEVYNVFLTDDPAEPVRVDTDVDGSNVLADPDVDYVRWIGFVLNDSSGDIIPMLQNGDLVHMERLQVGTAPSGVYTKLDISSFVPLARVVSFWGIVGSSSTGSSTLQWSLDGTDAYATNTFTNASLINSTVGGLDPTSLYFRATTVSAFASMQAVGLKR